VLSVVRKDGCEVNYHVCKVGGPEGTFCTLERKECCDEGGVGGIQLARFQAEGAGCVEFFFIDFGEEVFGSFLAVDDAWQG
jgi:hypothetical protein